MKMRIENVTSWIVLVMLAGIIYDGSEARSRYKHKDESKARFSYRRLRKHNNPKSEKPNIIVVMTDDQDDLLGSVKSMTKTLRILRDNGAHCVNSFVTTPMCCPSRSTFLTGMYAHNHNVYTNNQNCSSVLWQQTHETRNFATYLSNVGYRTGYFGKYLNEYNGSYIPPGWREWVGLVKNSRFYNYTINFNGNMIKHADNYYKDYFTDLIANDSVTFLKQSKQYFPSRPVMMVLSVPAPHGPEDAAPQYQHMFFNNTDHRTPSWNHAPNEDKQWLLKLTGKMEPIHQKFTDVLQRKRLQTLQSVDDLVEKIHRELKSLGELDNSFIMFTSDHGYHLGQFGLVKGKAMPYEFDVRVPLYIRGPGIIPGTRLQNMVANIDLAPTILDMAGVEIPDHMDGRSILKLLTKADNNRKLDRYKKGWRDSILLTRGKVTRKKLLGIIKAEKRRIFSKISEYDDENLQSILSPREMKLVKMCRQEQYRPPCKPNQNYECRTLDSGDLHLSRCAESPENRKLTIQMDTCICPDVSNTTQPLDGPDILRNAGLEGYMEKCRVLANNSVQCERELYRSVEAWKDHKDWVDEMIQFYKQRLENLKGIRKHLKRKRPAREFAVHVPGVHDLPNRDLRLSNGDATRSGCQCFKKEGEDEEFEEREVVYGDPGVDDDFEDDDEVNVFEDRFDTLNRRKNAKKENRRERLKRKRRKLKKKIQSCQSPYMNCFTHDNEHWRTPPYWDDGPFCFCPNSGNCTYWCVRTINETHNFLYCEFITKFISFYNMTQDPAQLRNAVHDLNYGVLQQLHEELNKLRACAGAKQCSLRSKPERQGKGPRHKHHHNRHDKSSIVGRPDHHGKWNRSPKPAIWPANLEEYRRGLQNFGR